MKRLVIACMFISALATAASAAVLEVPQNGGDASGIGYISGWKCPPNDNISVVIDGNAPIAVPSGVRRTDTASVCGNDGRNGYITQINFNLLGSGNHSISVRQNGQPFASGAFHVATFGTTFMTGKSGAYTLQNFPDAGKSTNIEWSQGAQNFIITGTSGGPAPTPSPTPTASGLAGLIGTWRFDYTIFVVSFNETYRLQTTTVQNGVQYLLGLDASGGPVTAGAIQDVSPGSTLPYTYALLDPSIILCRLFVFDRTGSTSLSGEYFQFDLQNGNCVSPSGPYSMTGTRLSQTAAQSMTPTRSLASLEGGDALAVEAANLSHQESADAEVQAAALELANKLRATAGAEGH